MQNRMKLAKLLGLAAVAGAMAVAVTPSSAQVIFTTNGVLTVNQTSQNVSAKATFSVDGNGNLVILLENTTVNGNGGTATRAGVLSDLFFTINGANPTLTYLSGNAPLVVQDGQANRTNVNLVATAANDETWQFKQYPGSTFPNNSNNTAFPYEYGISTVGDSGLFSGNIVGNDDYAIIAPNTNFHQGGLAQIPLVQSNATFTFGGFSGLNVNQIGNVAFSWGSAPDLMTTGVPPSSVPEPGSLAMCAGVAVPVLGLLRRKRKA